MSDKAAAFKTAMNGAMAKLESTMRASGGREWECFVIAYRPGREGAWLVIETPNADVREGLRVMQTAAGVSPDE